MKLLELIVKNVDREEIHPSANFFVQDWKAKIKKVDSFIRKPNSDSGIEWRGPGFLNNYSLIVTEIADDAATTIITREELMRAYDLVEQGYTLWFGGDCPVAAGSFVDVFYGDGEIFSSYDATALSWKTVIEPNNIIAYKVADIKPNELASPIKDVEMKMSSEIKMYGSFTLSDTESLMRDITKAVPEMMATDMVELADYLISQGWGKHE